MVANDTHSNVTKLKAVPMDHLQKLQSNASAQLASNNTNSSPTMILNQNDFNQIDYESNTGQLQLQFTKAQFDKMLPKLQCIQPPVATLQNLSGIAGWADNEQDRTAKAMLVSIGGYNASNQLHSIYILSNAMQHIATQTINIHQTIIHLS